MNVSEYKKNSITSEPMFFLFTCVKNGRDYINNLFDSLLKQTKKNFVHYIYEDGSDAPLNEMVDEYRKKANALEQPYDIFYEKNSVNIGLNMATKHCIDLCTSSYFIWIDCDNWVDSNFFNELEKTVKKNKKSIYFGTNRIDVDTKGNTKKYLSSKKSIKLISKRKQDVNFLCYGYKHSFFAINKRLFDVINPDHYFVVNRFFFNDNQIISFCIFSKYKFSFSKNAISFYLYREDSEANLMKDYEKDAINLFTGIKEISGRVNWKYGNYLDQLEHLHINELTAKKLFKQKRYEDSYLLFKHDIVFAHNKRIPMRYRLYYYKSSLMWMVFCKCPFLRKKILKL